MLAADQSWISLATNSAVALFFAFAILWVTRSQGRDNSLISLILSCAICTTVVGFGFILQPFIWETFISPPHGLGSIYMIEYQPLRSLKNLLLL